ncbi:MAG: ATP-binding protein [Ktedonobacteraceae bacterium]|nr:ATP-binding protein [Ktedonobacteraceae bacterium]
MESFVNREAALKHIDDAFLTLQDKKRLLQTPIMDFYGVKGIGKTLFLKKVQQRCQDERLRCIWLDGSQSNLDRARAIAQQVQQSGVTLPFEDESDHSPYQSASAVRILLQREPVVMLCDALDTNNKDQQSWLEILLRELTDDKNLFVVLASRRDLTFENERSLARKLTTIPLPPFDRAACDAYFDAIDDQIEPEVRTIIFSWTRGYPLALNVMTQAVMGGLDPRKEQSQKEIIARLTDQVLRQSLLAEVDPAERNWYLTILSLLSIPRHSNLVIMQDLIEQFTPQLKRENSLAYFGLPREINQTTEVLHWNTVGAGFSVDAPVRAIFLLKLRIEQPELYYTAHHFLAQTNRQWAADVSGADQVRYLREYLYHSVSSEDSATLAQFLTITVQEISKQFPGSLAPLMEEITQDNELKELLGRHLDHVESLMQKNIVAHTDYTPEG